MAGDSNKVDDTGKGLDVAIEKKDTGATVKKKQRGLLSRIWKALFRPYGDDYEKRLQHISKEEAAVHARIKKRSLRWRWMTRHLIILSVLSEVIAVGYAIMTTRQSDLNWKMRAIRVLPMFLLPALSSLAYSGLVSFMKMCDRKDQRTLERLRAERKEKIDELKEKTNYYITQQLIQRYDPDPSAKAAAATVLASKLGADSGLLVSIRDESELHGPTAKSNDVKLVNSDGLCNRKQLHAKSANAESTITQPTEEETRLSSQVGGRNTLKHNDQLVVGHHQPASNTNGGRWIARFAALLVGEDPTQSYALICGNCHMHNGLARKEDFPYITYYCPHCHALNKSLHLDGNPSAQPDSMNYSATPSDINPIRTESSSVSENVSSNSSPIAAAAETNEGSEVIASRDTKSVS